MFPRREPSRLGTDAKRPKQSFVWFLVFAAWIMPASLPAQTPPAEAEEKVVPEPKQVVGVRPGASDEAIRQRLLQVLNATPWYEAPEVVVDQGVVFLRGTAETAEAKEWAEKLSENTESVVAVVNEMTVDRPSFFEFDPALKALEELWISVAALLPSLGFSLVILALAALLALGAARGARAIARRRISAPLIRDLVGKAAAAVMLLLGFYVALRVVGLTRLAVTLIGGTGLVGLVIGIAFRDITENFLASIFLSVHQPFRSGDLVQIEEQLGIVQRLTIRTTVLMTLAGNHVQIPNSTVYKNTITNFSTNPNRREDFCVGIGYDDSIAEAQAIALGILAEHPAVLKSPEPWVLAEDLGSSTVNLRVYFWLDGRSHSWLKVRSSVIRLVKRAFQSNGISMPDEAREIIFPEGIPLKLTDELPAAPQRAESDNVATGAEAGLESDAGNIQKQAKGSDSPVPGRDLLARE